MSDLEMTLSIMWGVFILVSLTVAAVLATGRRR